ncbi:MAG TPA: RES domain-containing protein [Bryobacteraceae bacterium]|jgi:RES domain-containing protein|nr:RES domain-containing protein [Bryobacteraceae bacterium]
MRRTVVRSGAYYRVVAPGWVDPANTAYSKQNGGRWNPAGEFGALYLNATIQVAAANARAQHAGRAVKLFDLLPAARPELVTFDVPVITALNASTSDGIAALGFPSSFPYGIPWPPCQAIAREAHGAGLSGVASRSNAEATAISVIGEELALFEKFAVLKPRARSKFQQWYPDPIPGPLQR